MEFFANVVHALTSPVNCLANYGIAVAGDTVNLVHCVANNLSSIIPH